MEGSLLMIVHAIVIGAILYAAMRYVLGMRHIFALDRSIIIAAVALIYMILFGHRLPFPIR